MSWRASRTLPMFEAEYYVPILDQRLDEALTYTRTMFHDTLCSLETRPAGALEGSIWALMTELGIALPLALPMGRIVELQLIT